MGHAAQVQVTYLHQGLGLFDSGSESNYRVFLSGGIGGSPHEPEKSKILRCIPVGMCVCVCVCMHVYACVQCVCVHACV